MLINFNHLKTFYNALVHKMNSSRGNWEQNDPTADDYIKNRTHYSEGIKDVTVLEYIVDTDTESASPMDSAGPAIYRVYFDPTGLQPFVVGQQYSVKWNNASYTCVAKMVEGLPVLGDVELTEGYEGSGEPFLIALNPKENFGIIMTTQAGKYPITVTTRQEVIHKLDKKFIDLPDFSGLPDLPDNIVTTDKLEEVLPDNLVTSDQLATVAKSGSYNDLENLPTIYTDVIRYYTEQNLSNINKATARYNIGAADATNVVKLSAQTLTDAQKTQVIKNIGAAHVDASYTKEVSDKRYFVQSDWEQTDSSATDYIKNRTHGEEIHTEQTTKTISSTSEDKHIQIVTADLLKASDARLLIGSYSFRFYFEDVVYGERIPIFSGGSANVLGAGSAYRTVYYDEISGNYTLDIELENVVGTNEVSIVITSMIQKQLDEKYIPSTIARTNDFYTKEESDARYLIQSDLEQYIDNYIDEALGGDY